MGKFVELIGKLPPKKLGCLRVYRGCIMVITFGLNCEGYSYVDTFLDRGVNTFQFTEGVSKTK